jgi:transcriptional regulator GlxA family with amidase domain
MVSVDILALRRAGPSSLAITLDVLDAANRLSIGAGKPVFDWRVVTPGDDHVELRHGLSIAAQPIERVTARDLVIALGIGAAAPEEIESRLNELDARTAVGWLREARRRRVMLAGACTAVFLLGDAGALDDRRCTTTWWLSGVLARRCPAARVQADGMVVQDRSVITAGAVMAQLDLMLALVGRYANRALADETGRRLAASVRTSQAPYMLPAAIAATDPDLAAVEAFVVERLDRPITLKQIAEALGHSPRTLARRITAASGFLPNRFVQKIRLSAALRLIEQTRLPLSDIAARVGLADAAVLHRLVVRHTGHAPGRFRAAQGGGSGANGNRIPKGRSTSVKSHDAALVETRGQLGRNRHA